MGNETLACKQCTTIDSTVSIINEEPKFNLIDYKFRESSLDKSRNISSEIANFNKDYQEFIASLRSHSLRFEDSYFPPNDGSLGSQLMQELPLVKWKRIEQLFPEKRIYDRLQYPVQCTENAMSKINCNIHKALLEMSKHPQLISRAIPNLIIIKEGLFIVYLCLNGQCRNPVQVVIDDLIPVDSANRYIFAQKNQSIWMIILEKAFAKILGNYQRLKNLQVSEFFEEIVGIPVYSQTFYQPAYYIESSSLSIIGQQSVYYKFNLENKSTFHLSVWQPRKSLFGVDVSYVNLVAELVKETENGCSRIVFASQLQGNKLVISDSAYSPALTLEPGKYFIHLYGRFNKMINRRINIVAYSEQRTTLRQRQESAMLKLKSKMIERVFKDTLSKKRLSLVKQEKDIAVRFFWDGHRGVLCVKNQHSQVRQFKISILHDKLNDISFENEAEKAELTVPVANDKYVLVCFIRKEDHDVGHFYNVKAL